mmetsp:Transcript_3836/g.6034  ORF Transcript_3836/g.6034 Transcript_3836/m.6034 type:complete len:341 (-) Transcript_3836:354-1376(-)
MSVSISPALKTQMIAPSPATHASKIPSQSVLSGTHADLTTDRNRTSSRTCGSCRSPILPHLPTFMYNDEAFCSYDCRVRAYQLDCAARKIKKWKDESKNNRTKAQRTRRKRSDGRKNHQKKRCNDKNNGNNILAMPQCITDSPRDPKKLPVVRSKSVSTPYSQLPPIESITSSSVQSFNPLYRRDEQAISRMRPQKLPEFVSATIVSRKGSEHMTHLGFSTILIQLQQGIPSEYLGSVTACTIKWFSSGIWHSQLGVFHLQKPFLLEALLLDNNRIPSSSLILIGDLIRMRPAVKFKDDEEMSHQIKKDVLWTQTLLGASSSNEKDANNGLQTCHLCTIM